MRRAQRIFSGHTSTLTTLPTLSCDASAMALQPQPVNASSTLSSGGDDGDDEEEAVTTKLPTR